MVQDDKTVLVLDNEQAEVLEKATELLFRLHIGQFEEIKWRLRSRISNKSCVNWDTIEGALLLLRGGAASEQHCFEASRKTTGSPPPSSRPACAQSTTWM